MLSVLVGLALRTPPTAFELPKNYHARGVLYNSDIRHLLLYLRDAGLWVGALLALAADAVCAFQGPPYAGGVDGRAQIRDIRGRARDAGDLVEFRGTHGVDAEGFE